MFQIPYPQSLVFSFLSVMFFLLSLKPLDVEFMKAIHSKVNIVPVIAKADTLTLRERDRLKRRVSVMQTSSLLLLDIKCLSVVRGGISLTLISSNQKIVI